MSGSPTASPTSPSVFELGAAFEADAGEGQRLENPCEPFARYGLETEGPRRRVTDSLEAGRIVPLHYDGWAHFTEGQEEAAHLFAQAGLADRVRWLKPGVPTVIA